MYVNGQEKTLDVPATLINSRTLVPVRAISEAFGLSVGWDGKNNIVSILSNTEVFQMLYAKDSRSRVFAKSSAATQASHGWQTYPVTAVYSADGTETIVATSEVDQYLNDGYYAFPVIIVYAADGTEVVIAKSELKSYLANGYSKDKPIITTETGNDKTYDYSVYGNTDEEYLAKLTVSLFLKKLEDHSNTQIYSVYGGYYEKAYIVVADLQNSTKKRNRGTVVLRLETNSKVSNLYGSIGAVSGTQGPNYEWAAPLVDQKTTLFKGYNSNKVKDSIMEMIKK